MDICITLRKRQSYTADIAPACNILHHKVRAVAASATAHGLRLAACKHNHDGSLFQGFLHMAHYVQL